MNRILVVNLNLAIDKTAVVGRLCPGGIHRVAKVVTLPGGKGVNVARALQTLDCNAVLTGLVAGHNGRWITEALAREGLRSVCVPFSPGESRLCFSAVDKNGVSTDFNEEGPIISAATANKFCRVFEKNLRDCDCVIFSGRLCAGLKPDFFAGLIARVKTAGKLTALDTSGEPLKKSLAAGPTLIKINSEEFRFACGKKLSQTALMNWYKKQYPRGTRYIIITDGPRPALAITPESLWRCTPPAIKVVTPVGAGDSFMAGVVCGFAKHLSRQDCVRLGAGASVSDCLSVGAGIVDKKQCMHYAKTVRLEKLASFEACRWDR